MERKSSLIWLGATVAIAWIAFEGGRQIKIATGNNYAGKTPEANVDRIDSRPNINVSEAEFANVRIENIGQVSFEQAYEFLHNASPEALMHWAGQLEKMPTGPRKTAAITSFYKVLTQVDTKTAVDVVLSTGQRDARTTAFRAIKGAAPASGLPEVGRLMIDLKARGYATTDLMLEWSRFDPLNASKFAAAHLEDIDSNGLQLLLTNWAAADPAAAKTWLDQLDPKRQEPDVYEGFVGGWLESDRTAAVSYLVEHAGDQKFGRAIERAALELFAESQDTARSFVLNLPAKAKDAAINQIEAYATGRVFGSEIEFPVEEVAKWIFAMPQDVWGDHIGHVVRSWSDKSPDAVEAWMNAMPINVRDQVAAKFCLAYDWEEPQRSIEAGLRITDRRLREQTFQGLVKQVGTLKRARELLQRVNLSSRDEAELNRIVNSL